MKYFAFDHLKDVSILSHGIEPPLVSAGACKPSCTNLHLHTKQFRCNCISSRRKSVALQTENVGSIKYVTVNIRINNVQAMERDFPQGFLSHSSFFFFFSL